MVEKGCVKGSHEQIFLYHLRRLRAALFSLRYDMGEMQKFVGAQEMDINGLLKAVKHRPFPMPAGPWVLTQRWHELLFAHWPLKAEVLRPLLPPTLPLDTYEGEAWVAIVPFWMSNVSPRGLPPVSAVSTFPELNLRTYVSVDGIPGVYFFSLDAGNPVAVQIARTFFHLPYFNARMQHRWRGDTLHYSSIRSDSRGRRAEVCVRYRPTGPVSLSTPGTLVSWFTERYCLYTTYKNRVYRAYIHHRQWPLQPAEWEIERQTLAAAHDVVLPDCPPLLHYADVLDMLAWPISRIL